jgi:hypothetical protein
MLLPDRKAFVHRSLRSSKASPLEDSPNNAWLNVNLQNRRSPKHACELRGTGAQ